LVHLQRLVIAPQQCSDRIISLMPEQQHYLNRVLRLRSGDRFIAILAQGEWWLTELKDIEFATAHLLEPIAIATELVQPVTLCVAIPKGQGFDEVVRAVTELGVTTLVPLLSERTAVQPSGQKQARWQRIATEAAEQSLRQTVPSIHSPLSFAEVLALLEPEQFQGYICVTDTCVPDIPVQNFGQALENLPQVGTLMMVGPEGGWTPAEQSQAITQGFQPVSLGNRTLRSVTAAIAAMAILATRMDAMKP
jgi:16S rRNA (uracil1498-N3)-methyltransferase